jgi:hypothetical protein
MTEKWSMPPASEWQGFSDQLTQAQPTPGGKVLIDRGKDRGLRWQLNQPVLEKVGTVLGIIYRIYVGDVRQFMMGYGVNGYASLKYQYVPNKGAFSAYNYQISVNPLLSPDAANYSIWHEIQHIFQIEEKRHDPAEANPHNLPMVGDVYDKYLYDPSEIDADEMAEKMQEISHLPLVTPLDITQGSEAAYYQELLSEGWEHTDAVDMLGLESEIQLEEVKKNRDRLGFVTTADYQGWSNWETWNTSLMMDNEQELYNKVRELAEKYRKRPEAGEKALENWAIENVIGPYNAERIEDAKEWNTIPEEERIDYNYEDFKEKHPDSMDLLHGLVGGPDVGDTEPQIIDPTLVNWNEIFSHLTEELSGEEDYEKEMNDYQKQDIGWATNHSPEQNYMRDAFYRAHGAKPEWETEGYNDPNAYHNIRVNVPFEHVQKGAGGYRWPEDYISPESRVKMWNLFGKDYQDHPDAWNTPAAQEILKNDPRTSEIMQNGFENSLSDHTNNVIGDIMHGKDNPYIPQMIEALKAKGYTPEQIADITKQRWRYDPETQHHIDLTKDYDAAPPIDKSLDQPSDFTMPENWSHTIT